LKMLLKQWVGNIKEGRPDVLEISVVFLFMQTST
jgi:hypothetical protein